MTEVYLLFYQALLSTLTSSNKFLQQETLIYILNPNVSVLFRGSFWGGGDTLKLPPGPRLPKTR